jgi:hypothetical protein
MFCLFGIEFMNYWCGSTTVIDTLYFQQEGIPLQKRRKV